MENVILIAPVSYGLGSRIIVLETIVGSVAGTESCLTEELLYWQLRDGAHNRD